MKMRSEQLVSTPRKVWGRGKGCWMCSRAALRDDRGQASAHTALWTAPVTGKLGDDIGHLGARGSTAVRIQKTEQIHKVWA